MDKVKLTFIVLIFLIGCKRTGEFNYATDNLVFEIGPFLKLDFVKNIMTVNCIDTLIEDSLVLSRDEREKILDYFQQSKITAIKGRMAYHNEKNIISPPSEFKIKFLVNGKIRSELIVDDNLIKNGESSVSNDPVQFCKDVKNVLSRNPKIIKGRSRVYKCLWDKRLFEL